MWKTRTESEDGKHVRLSDCMWAAVAVPTDGKKAQDPRFGSVVRRVLWRALSLGRARSWLHLVSLLRGPGNAKALLASDLTNIERNGGLFHLLSF
jgi:hypothetical protein